MPCYNNSRPNCTMPPIHHTHSHPVIDSLAVASVIRQPYDSQTYDVKTALIKGTIYPDLYKPYTGRGGCR